MKFALCIPVYNEEEIIVPTIRAIEEVLQGIPEVAWHILVADNASSDKTVQRVRELDHPHVSVINISQKGKGRAIRIAAETPDADIFGFIDADLSAHPTSILHLLEALQDGADIAIGSRLLNPVAVRRGLLRTSSSRLFNAARKWSLGIDVVDSQCGLKLMNRKGIEILKLCKEDTWFLDIELLARAQKRGLRIAEIPIAWNEHHYEGRSSKLSLVRDGLGALRAFWRIRNNIRTQ